MSLYSYSNSKVIDEVSFKRTANGALRAYVHACPQVGQGQIEDILKAFQKEDYICIPFTVNNKPVVEVRGFKRDAELITLLHKNGWVDDKPKIAKELEDNVGWMEKIKKRGLQSAGVLYSIGDVNFIAYGLKDSSPLDMAAGICYALPTPVLMAYGRNDQSQIQIKDFARQMAKEFKKEVAALPDCSTKEFASDKRQGTFQHINELLQRYPSEFMNLSYAAAGACIFAAAVRHLGHLKGHGLPANTVDGWMKHLGKTQPGVTREVATATGLKNIRTENYLNAGVGVATMASGLFGTLVKEKVRDVDDKPKTGLSGLWEKMRERPLTVAGAGFMVSTLLHAGATWVAVKGQDPKHKKAVPYRVAFVISALLAELMVAVSSKGHGEGVVSDSSVDESAIALAADLIVKQPKGMQNALIEEMGKFLGRPEVLAMKDEEATRRLRHYVEHGRGNPWALSKEAVATHLSQPHTHVAQPAPGGLTGNYAMPAWQTKVTATDNGMHVPTTAV